jgi:aspartyl-tRNA(Asn)/glutamyl-tRNA(Gln) amidotransferase subunit A
MNVGLEAGRGLHYLTVAAAARAIADKQLSPVELMKAHLARIEKLDPGSTPSSGSTPRRARGGEGRRGRGERGRLRGPLHGVPVGIKDIIDVAGLPTTCHSKILEGNMRPPTPSA